jgi:hypothetical protein
MDYFVVSSDYPELFKVVEEIFINIETIDVITGESSKLDPRSELTLGLTTKAIAADL